MTAGATTIEFAATLTTGLSNILLFLLTPGFAVFIRWRTLKGLDALMQATSPDGTGSQVAAAPASEVVAPIAPTLNVFSATLLLDGAFAARERFVARALAEFRGAYRADALAALGYFAFPSLGGLISGISGGTADSLGPGLVVGAFWLLLASMGYVLHRSQFRAIESRSRLERGIFGLLYAAFVGITFAVTALRGMNPTALKWIAAQMLKPAMRVIVVSGYAAIVVFAAFAIGGGVGAGLGLAALLHVCLFVRCVRRVYRVPGVRLLVLRVFGFDASAQFTFDGVLRFWSHFGHFFTIVDPSYWRHRNRLWSARTLRDALVAGAWVFVALSVGFGVVSALHMNETVVPVVSLGLAVPVLAVHSRFSDRRLQASFIRNHDQLSQLLGRLDARPRRIDLSYKSLETRCHVDTWRVAVADFASRADAVLMDLRGFSEARKGCQFEVNFLLDTIRLDRVVFLIDATLDRAIFTTLILDAWHELRSTSPNLNNPSPQVQVYEATAGDEPDIQAILDLLIYASTHQAA